MITLSCDYLKCSEEATIEPEPGWTPNGHINKIGWVCDWYCNPERSDGNPRRYGVLCPKHSVVQRAENAE